MSGGSAFFTAYSGYISVDTAFADCRMPFVDRGPGHRRLPRSHRQYDGRASLGSVTAARCQSTVVGNGGTPVAHRFHTRWHSPTARNLAIVVVVLLALSNGPGLGIVTASIDPPSDAETISSETGWALEEVQLMLQQQAAFGDYILALAQSYPGTYAGAWISGGPRPSYHVRFKGYVPSDLPAPPAFEITITGEARYSVAELEERANDMAQELQALGYRDIMVTHSVQDHVVEAVVRHDNLALLLNELPLWLRSDDVRISTVMTPVGLGDATYGGAWMRDDGARECTSGFTVQSGTTLGVTTAGHCWGINQYERPTDGVLISAPFKAEHRGSYGDIEWHTTADSEVAEFYADVSDRRSVYSIEAAGSIAIGNWYCVFGRKTGAKRCDYVYRTAVSCWIDDVWTNKLVMRESRLQTGGDSGGPVFLNNKAVGSHVGGCSDRDVFGVADFFDEAIGATVLTK